MRCSSWHHGHGAFTADYWLDLLERHPAQRYISAGNPAKITFPKAMRGRLAARYAHRAVAY